jgi:hypothetical protein
MTKKEEDERLDALRETNRTRLLNESAAKAARSGSRNEMAWMAAQRKVSDSKANEKRQRAAITADDSESQLLLDAAATAHTKEAETNETAVSETKHRPAATAEEIAADSLAKARLAESMKTAAKQQVLLDAAVARNLALTDTTWAAAARRGTTPRSPTQSPLLASLHRPPPPPRCEHRDHQSESGRPRTEMTRRRRCLTYQTRR